MGVWKGGEMFIIWALCTALVCLLFKPKNLSGWLAAGLAGYMLFVLVASAMAL